MNTKYSNCLHISILLNKLCKTLLFCSAYNLHKISKMSHSTASWTPLYKFVCCRVEGVDLSRVGGISGAGQQHGSIYWRPGVEQVLRYPLHPLFPQIISFKYRSGTQVPYTSFQFNRSLPLNIEQVLRSPIHPSKAFASFQFNRSLPLNIEQVLRSPIHPFKAFASFQYSR